MAGRVRKAFEHRDELLPDRKLEAFTNGSVVKIVCDSPGIASVSHVLTLPEWELFVASVRAELG